MLKEKLIKVKKIKVKMKKKKKMRKKKEQKLILIKKLQKLKTIVHFILKIFYIMHMIKDV